MKVITLAQVKTYTGITDTASDAAITAMLPIVDAKVKAITGRRWSDRYALDITTGEVLATIRPLDEANYLLDQHRSANVGRRYSMDIFADFIEIGAQIAATGLPEGTHIADVRTEDYDDILGDYQAYARVELSEEATATASTEATIGIGIAYLPIIAKLCLWMVNDQTGDTPQGGIASRSLGDASVSYADKYSNLDGRYGVPAYFVRALPRYARGY